MEDWVMAMPVLTPAGCAVRGEGRLSLALVQIGRAHV